MCRVFVFRIEESNKDMTDVWIERFNAKGWKSYSWVIGQSYPPYTIMR